VCENVGITHCHFVVRKAPVTLCWTCVMVVYKCNSSLWPPTCKQNNLEMSNTFEGREMIAIACLIQEPWRTPFEDGCQPHLDTTQNTHCLVTYQWDQEVFHLNLEGAIVHLEQQLAEFLWLWNRKHIPDHQFHQSNHKVFADVHLSSIPMLF